VPERSQAHVRAVLLVPNCICVTFWIMVLDRLSNFAAAGVAGKSWVWGGRIILATVVLGNAVGLAGNFAAAVYYQQAADIFSSASVFYAANNTAVGDEYVASGIQLNRLAFSTSSVQVLHPLPKQNHKPLTLHFQNKTTNL
jgi:hypothetical protein